MYALWWGIASQEFIDAMTTIEPPLSVIARAPCFIVAATPRTFTASVLSSAARSRFGVSLQGGTTPAFATTTSSRP